MTLLASKKSVKAVMAVVGLMFFAYGYYLKQRNDANKPDDTLAQEIVTHEARDGKQSADSSPHKKSAEQVNNISTSEEVHKKLDLPEYQELVGWNNQRGYISAEDMQIYESYSEETLKDLSTSGDVKAMLVLGRYYLTKDYRPQESAAQFHKAAVYGSTVALVHLALSAQADLLRDEAYKTAEGQAQDAIESMALFKVAAMRGDLRGSFANINAYKEVYKVRYKQELVIGQEQLDKIDLRAKAIYDELQQERYQLGLGDFDNSTPEVLKKSYGSK
jgi:hypothetical protein